jgi:NAD(P)-dependent dehydrogenase (short-subunit alcohol dehydrogenase family)
MSIRLDEQIILVTGGGRGRAHALALTASLA